MSEIKTKIRTYNDVIDLFGEEKAADMLSEALDWSTIDPKNDKKNIMERKPLLLDPYMTYEDEDYCKHIVAGFLGDRDLDWASGFIDEEKIKNGQVMPADLKSALSMALDNELSTSWAYLDALSSQCAEIFNKFAGYIESAGLARGVLVPGEYELDSNALNADVSERFNIQYGFQCDQMIDAMQFDMTLILTEKVDSMDGYRLIQSVCDWREENLEVIEDAENNLDYGKVPSYVAYERPADIGTTIIDELCASQGTAVEKLVNYPTTKFERTMRDELFEALAVNETTISLMAKVPSSVFLDAVACMDSRYMSGHTVDTGHAFTVSPGTYEPYIGIHDPVYGAGYMMVELDKPFEIPMNRIWIAMDDYSGPETKEGLRGMYHSPQDVSAFSDPFCGSVSVTPESDNFGERWADISVNLNNPCQNDRTVFLDMNNLYNPAIIEAIYGFGTVEGIVSHSGSCSYPAFTFDADVISQMRNTQEFMDANTPDDYKLVAVKVGYNFALVPKIELSGIETNATETIVDISGKQYGLLAGKTFEDSQKLDAVLDTFPEYAIKDYKVPNKISVFIMPVQMYWKDDPSEIIETNFSFEDTYGLAIDDSVTFSGYTQNELVDMIGREDNGEDFVITGVGAGHYVGTCKKEPSKNKSVSEKTCNARESSGRLDADRNVDRNDIAKDKEVK